MQDQGASLPSDGWLGHLLLHMQLETQALGVLISSYCCSTYRVADPFSSLGTFSSSSIGGPVFHPIDDCEHPLLYLPGTGIASKETAISGSFQQNLAHAPQIPMKGVIESKFGAKMKGWTIQRLPHPGIHPIISHQAQTLLHMPGRFC